MISVIVPAHNEANVIGATLRSLTQGSTPADLEVLVVCNGCTDDTARIAAGVPGVTVLFSSAPSKARAVNLGLRTARGESVVCVDADIRLGGDGVAGLARAICEPGVMAAGPRVEMEFAPGTSWAVRAYYKLWFSLPYVAEGMIGCGVYALSREGMSRVGELPDLIADDGFVRASFSPQERRRVDSVVSVVRGPRTLSDLIKIKTRSRLGVFQLNARFGGKLPGQNERAQHTSAWMGLVVTPRLWMCIASYLYVNAISRARARRQLESMHTYVWERDESSRPPEGASG